MINLLECFVINSCSLTVLDHIFYNIREETSDKAK